MSNHTIVSDCKATLGDFRPDLLRHSHGSAVVRRVRTSETRFSRFIAHFIGGGGLGEGRFHRRQTRNLKGESLAKLSGQQQFLLEELNVIASTLGDDTITFLSFKDEAVERWEGQHRGRKANVSVSAG